MNFELRDATADDLDSCIRLLPREAPYDPAYRQSVKAMWQEIFARKTGLGFVATEPTRQNRVVHFGFSVFVSDERAQAYRECRLPLIPRRVVAEWAAGSDPFLNVREIACANAGGGLNVLGLHYGSVGGDEEFDHHLRAVSLESMRRMHAGWNIRSIIVEALSTPDRRQNVEPFGEALGFCAGYYSRDHLRAVGIDPEKAPCVWSATREESLRKKSYAMAVLFGQYTPPRGGFSANEQQILLLALDGKTDEAIAGLLNASIATVKKRFRMIHEKFRSLVPNGASQGTQSEPARGAETRRHLLNYVREHPEELRPYELQRKAAAASRLRAS